MSVFRLPHDFQPPQGIKFHLRADVSGQVLSDALRTTIAFLIDVMGASTPWVRYDDWWQHDGLHFYRATLSPQEAMAMVASVPTLLSSMPGDFMVCVGIVPQNNDWYLRFYLDPEPDDSTREGRFDLTLSAETAQRYRAEVVSRLGLEVQEQDAWTYYRAIGAELPSA